MNGRIALIAAHMLAWAAVQASNPITTSLYTADPSAISYRDTLWIFTGHDESAASTSFIMNDWYVFSSADLVTYRNWGTPLRAADFPWASGAAFAGHAIERNGKFYWYVAALHRNVKVNEGFGIGVAVASHPKGPWTPVATALITDKTSNSIDLNIDPAVYIDLDGTAWLYWGSWGAARRVKLKDNMTEIDGTVEVVSASGFFEAPWIHRFDGNYYFSYASGYPSTTNHAMSSRLSGPWIAKGVINTKMANSETNHQAIVRHGGHWLFVYHTGDSPGGQTYRRSVAVDELYYDTSGAIKPIVRTATGPKRVNNSPIADGSYRLIASHSGLALQDSGTKIVQMRLSASDSQQWKLTRKGNGRTYGVRNAATGRFLAFPSAARLTKARTVGTEVGVVIENASVEDGYMFFADSSKDHVGDILDMSTVPGKELVVWRRTGTRNQSFLLERIATTGGNGVKSKCIAPSISSASTVGGIQLSSKVRWVLRDLNGARLGNGFSDWVPVPVRISGIVLLEMDGKSRAVLLR